MVSPGRSIFRALGLGRSGLLFNQVLGSLKVAGVLKRNGFALFLGMRLFLMPVGKLGSVLLKALKSKRELYHKRLTKLMPFPYIYNVQRRE